MAWAFALLHMVNVRAIQKVCSSNTLLPEDANVQGTSLSTFLDLGISFHRLALQAANLGPWVDVKGLLPAVSGIEAFIDKKVDACLTLAPFESGIDSYGWSSTPRICLEVRNFFVVSKTGGQEDDSEIEAEPAPGQVVVCHALGCAFLNCLDVPSSGLVLAASTFEAYCRLLWQIDMAKVETAYAILCHRLASELQLHRTGAIVEGPHCLLPVVAASLCCTFRLQVHD